MNTEAIEKAKTALTIVADTGKTLAERIEAYHVANTARQEAHVGWKKIGDVPADIQAAIAQSTETAPKSIAAPKRAGKAPKVVAEKKPLVPGRLHLRNAVQVALYNQAFLVELGAVGLNGGAGKWSATRPEGHAEPWQIAKVSVSKTPKDESTLGVDFESPKANYNLNDSNWVNDPAVTPKLLEIANSVAKKPMVKKEIAAELLDMKNIFQMRLAGKGEKASAPATEPSTQEPATAEA